MLEERIKGAFEGVECYVPTITVVVRTADGHNASRVKPAVAGLMFVKCQAEIIPEIRGTIRGNAMFYPSADGAPARIREREMQMFRLVASSGDTGLEFLGDDVADYAVGQRVRVLQGVFKGAEGCIRRIRGNRRLVVSVNGICAVATSYIPACFLEHLPDASAPEGK
ncbi:MAG: UpxY family transcription antiterminator [Muribaculaceae bacterium]|nr:UpxY family transcription antiterminator [Muribaculaceae bacterium]